MRRTPCREAVDSPLRRATSASITHPVRQPEDLEPGEYVQILVRDTGHGMDREVQARAFEPFFTTKKLGQGTGLGLSMAYGIVKQSGGHIRLDSKPGDGCTFWIHLPRVAPASGQRCRHRRRRTTLPRGSETILLAEDENGVRKLIGAYLRGSRLSCADGIRWHGRNFAGSHLSRYHSPAAQRSGHAQTGRSRTCRRVEKEDAAAQSDLSLRVRGTCGFRQQTWSFPTLASSPNRCPWKCSPRPSARSSTTRRPSLPTRPTRSLESGPRRARSG